MRRLTRSGALGEAAAAAELQRGSKRASWSRRQPLGSGQREALNLESPGGDGETAQGETADP